MMSEIWTVLESLHYNTVERIRTAMPRESVSWACIAVF